MALLLDLTSECIMMTLSSVLETADPVTQCRILEDLNLQHHQCENLYLTFRTCIYFKVWAG